MTYSLISAATLGFDLVRLPAGRQLAGVLLTGLDADAETAHALAARHPRHQVGAAERPMLALRSRRARELAANGTPRLSGVSGAGGTSALLAQLETSMLGTSPSLERLVRDDLLDPELVSALRADAQGLSEERRPSNDVVDEATDVLADAALAAYAAATLAPAMRRELSAPYEEALAATSAGSAGQAGQVALADLGPQAEATRALLAQVGAADDSERARWRDAVDVLRDRQRPWATSMHEASWAAHICDRTRAAARAQLLAVQAFCDAGFDAADGARGVWNALAGCVQAVVLADVVEDSSLDVLLEPWVLVTGASPLVVS